MQAIRDYLARHDYRHLFIEELGWDIASGELAVQSAAGMFALRRIAQKRGVQVFTCEVSPKHLTDRKLLRVIEAQVAKQAVEHVAIYYSEQLGQQCWQWAAISQTGSRLRHREHPFTSRVPPEKVVARIHSLAVAFDAEDATSITDITRRLRSSFDNDAEFASFFRGARWRELSLSLHRKWQATRSNHDLNAFLSVHLPLLPWAAKMFAPRQMDRDDAAQVAFFALHRAALGFDPDHGAQFSTYASRAFMQTILRVAPAYTDMIKCGSTRYRLYRHCERRADRLSVQFGAWRGTRLLELLSVRKTTQPASVFRAIKNIGSLDDPSEQFRRMLNHRIDPTPDPVAQLANLERIRRLPSAIDSLEPREAAIVRKRFGLDGTGRESTLEQVAMEHGLTKERVRQILLRIFTELRTPVDGVTVERDALDDVAFRTQHGSRGPAQGSTGFQAPPNETTNTPTLESECEEISSDFTLRSENGLSPKLFQYPLNQQSSTEVSSELLPTPLISVSRDLGRIQSEPSSLLSDSGRVDADVKLIQRAVDSAGVEVGVSVSDLITTLRLPGSRVRAALHALARSGEVERGTDLRWRPAIPKFHSNGTQPIPPQQVTIRITATSQPSLFGATP